MLGVLLLIVENTTLDIHCEATVCGAVQYCAFAVLLVNSVIDKIMIPIDKVCISFFIANILVIKYNHFFNKKNIY